MASRRRTSLASTRVDWVDGDDAVARAAARRTPRSSRSSSQRRTTSASATRYRIETPSGGTARLRVIGVYRDPSCSRERSSRRTCSAACRPRATPGSSSPTRVRASTRTLRQAAPRRRARGLPDRGGRVAGRATADADQRPARPVRLPALRAARDERRDLAVRNRELALPLDPRAHARVRAAARRRRDPGPGAGGWSATRASSPR